MRAADPVNPEEAIDWFRQQVPVSPEQWAELDSQAKRRAFTVAGVASLDVLHHVWRAIDRANAEGTPFADFQRDVSASLESQWGGPIHGRVETIFRTNVQSAYAAGRWQQMRDPDVVADRPFWQFMAILDSGTTQICRPLEEVTRPANDGFWATNYPPLHFQCRSSVITLSVRQAESTATVPTETPEPPTDGFGGAPDLSEWQPRQEDYPSALWGAFTAWNHGRANQP